MEGVMALRCDHCDGSMSTHLEASASGVKLVLPDENVALAHYVAHNRARVKLDPEWYDAKHGVTFDKIVGWCIWYSDGKGYSSLDTPASKLPSSDAQVMHVFTLRDDEPGRLTRHRYTRDVYPIPGSDVIVEGAWTSILNHNRIFKATKNERWPPSWIED